MTTNKLTITIHDLKKLVTESILSEAISEFKTRRPRRNLIGFSVANSVTTTTFKDAFNKAEKLAKDKGITLDPKIISDFKKVKIVKNGTEISLKFPGDREVLMYNGDKIGIAKNGNVAYVADGEIRLFHSGLRKNIF